MIITTDVRKYLPSQTVVSDEHVEKQVDKLFHLITTTFSETPRRVEKLKSLYHDMMPALVNAPASSRIHFHNAYPGGYLDHVLHVVEAAYKLRPVYESLGGVLDFTEQEMMFAALHHDLGKLGDEDGPAYIPTYDRRDNEQGTYFKANPVVQVMGCNDRTMYLLNKYEISCTKNELLAIKMADGMFDDANKVQYLANGYFPHRSHLGYLIHWADWMACITEKDRMRVQYEANIKREDV